MADYTITFMPLRATSGAQPYVLSIGSGSGNVPLKGGAQPFTTQESDDDDMFTPIRTQTGYFRIVDDGKDANGNAFDWKSLIPATDTSMPVTLTRGGTVVWRGFMQAQDFGSVLYGNPQDREFPVQCVLSVLGGTDINYTQTAIQNFAYLLKQIVDAIPSAYRPTEFYIQGGTDAQEWLLKRIDWQNFVSEDADGLTARFTMYQCLEDMCRFWGWTARTKGTAMYLTCADDSNQTTWMDLTYAELGQLATYTSGTIPGDPSYTFETEALTGDIFASVNNDEYVQRGVKKATVSADGNYPGDIVMQAYPDSVVKTMGGSYTEQYPDCYAVYTQNKYDFSSAFLIGECPSTTNAAFCLMKVKKNINDGGQDYSVIRIADTNSGSNRLASFETVYHHSYYDNTVQNGGFDYGGILINFDIFRKGKRFEDYDSGGIGKKHILLRVGIGVDRQNALWYNGRTWSSTAASISVRIGDQTQRANKLELNTNQINLTGKLFVDFYGSSDMPVESSTSKRVFEVVGFSVEFKRRVYSFLFDKQEGVSSQEYISKNNNKTDNEFMTDCIYASGNNMLFGYGVVLETDGKWMGQLTYGSTQKWAEQHLADRVTSYWQTSKRRLTVETRTSAIADITPRHKVTIDGMTGYPIAISHEWRDDVTQVTILQL